MVSKDVKDLIDRSIVYAGIQLAIGALYVSSTLQIRYGTDTEQKLHDTVSALRGYVFVATLIVVGSVILMYITDGILGAILTLVMNLVPMLWLAGSIYVEITTMAKRLGVKVPQIFGTCI